MYVSLGSSSSINMSDVKKVCNKYQKNNVHQHRNADQHNPHMPLTTSGYSAIKHFIDLFLVQYLIIVKYKTNYYTFLLSLIR
jgi:hypothetical protein